MVITYIETFKSKSLPKEYTIVYTDATYLSFRKDASNKEEVHITIDIAAEGNKVILDYTITPHESTEIRTELLNNFEHSELQHILLTVQVIFRLRKKYILKPRYIIISYYI